MKDSLRSGAKSFQGWGALALPAFLPTILHHKQLTSSGDHGQEAGEDRGDGRTSKGKGRAAPAEVIREGLSGEASSERHLGSQKDGEEHSGHRGEQVQRPRAGSVDRKCCEGPGRSRREEGRARLPKILPNGSK